MLPLAHLHLLKNMLHSKWRNGQLKFLPSHLWHIRVFYPNTPSYRHPSIPAMYRRHEQAKKREYGDRICEVEMASFIPLVFATTGGMGREASAFYRRLADLMAAKNNSTYSTTMALMRCVLSFSPESRDVHSGQPVIFPPHT